MQNGQKSFLTDGTVVSASAELKMPNLFGGLIGTDFVDLKVEARAEKQESEPICLLALDDTSAGSVSVYGNATVNAPNCTAMANSKHRHAVKQVGRNAEIRALRIGASSKGKLSKGVFVLEPGTYCGGISITPGATVHLLPGIYVMLDGPLIIGANSILSGDEVTLAFFGPGSTLNSSSGSQITLSSPRSGTYKNIQFISDRIRAPGKVGEEVFTLSSTTLVYDGAMYLPEQRVWVKGNSHVTIKTPEVAMVANRFRFQDASDVSILQDDVIPTPSRFRYAARLSL